MSLLLLLELGEIFSIPGFGFVFQYEVPLKPGHVQTLGFQPFGKKHAFEFAQGLGKIFVSNHIGIFTIAPDLFLYLLKPPPNLLWRI
jgi:hypothetical protein